MSPLHEAPADPASGDACLASDTPSWNDGFVASAELSRPRLSFDDGSTPLPLRRASTHYLMAPPRLMIQANVEWQEVWVDIWIGVPEESLVHSASIRTAAINWAKVRGAVGGRIFCNGQPMTAF